MVGSAGQGAPETSLQAYMYVPDMDAVYRRVINAGGFWRRNRKIPTMEIAERGGGSVWEHLVHRNAQDRCRALTRRIEQQA
jgi:hypothetical protein